MAKKPKSIVTPAPITPEPQQVKQVVVEAAPVPEVQERVAPMETATEPVIETLVEEAASVTESLTTLAVGAGTTVIEEDRRSPGFRSIEARLQKYATEMSPSVPMDAHRGALNQAELFSTLLSVFKLPIAEFSPAMDMVLRIFRTYQAGSFNKAYLFRFLDNVRLSKTDLDTFSGLLHLYGLAANPATRNGVVGRVNIKQIAAGMDDASGQLLLAYFNRS